MMARTRLHVDELVVVDASVDEALGQQILEYQEEIDRLD